MLPTWRKLLQEDLDILVYSGDMDGILPTLGTLNWINALKLDLREPFQAWLAPNGEPASPVQYAFPGSPPYHADFVEVPEQNGKCHTTLAPFWIAADISSPL